MDSSDNNKQKVLSFLKDDKFIQWRLCRTVQLNEYWAAYIHSHPEQSEALDEAIKIFSGVRLGEKEKLSSEEKGNLYESIKDDIENIKTKKIQRRIRLFYASASVAASIILFCFVYMFVQNEHSYIAPSNPFTQNGVIAQARQVDAIYNEPYTEDDIRIIVGNNEKNAVVIGLKDKLKISDTGDLRLTNSKGKVRYIHLSKDNLLIVPKGKHQKLALSDGTKVWLNSETSIGIPKKFSNTRDVHIKGEAYFDVAHRDNQPFIVHTSNYNIRVYGTKFNVMSYANSRKSEVVLAQGSVAICMKGKHFKLRPNEMFALNGRHTSVERVNATDYTCWKDGMLVFHHTSIYEIMERLSRYYGRELSIDKSAMTDVNTMKCSGSLYLTTLDKVLTSIYAIVNKQISYDNEKIYVE